MFLRVLYSEWIKFITIKVIWVFLLFYVVLSQLCILPYYGSDNFNKSENYFSEVIVIPGFFMVLQVIAGIFISTSEYSSNTIKVTLQYQLNPTLIFGAKTVLSLFLGGISSLIVILLGVLPVSLLLNTGIYHRGLYIFWAVFSTFVLGMLYVFFGMALGSIIKSSIGSIMFYLLWLVVELMLLVVAPMIFGRKVPWFIHPFYEAGLDARINVNRTYGIFDSALDHVNGPIALLYFTAITVIIGVLGYLKFTH